jgi:hypothetical protein
MEPIGCLETKVRNYHYTLRNSQEQRSSRVTIELFFPVASTVEFKQRWQTFFRPAVIMSQGYERASKWSSTLQQ